MPFNSAQIDMIGHYSIANFAKNDPIDQVNWERPLWSMLVKNKVNEVGGNQFYSENIYISNDSNGQNYFGADQVSYNSRDPGRLTQFAWYNYHNGFGFDEDTLKSNGIIKTDDREAVASDAEKVQLSNLLKQSFYSMRMGTQEDLDIEYHLDGTQSAKAVPGLSNIVSLTPGTGIVGGIDGGTALYWRNNTDLAIVTTTPSDGNINAAMKRMQRANMLYGGRRTNFIIAGKAYLEALEKENRAINHVHVVSNGRSGTDLDGAAGKTFFDGVEVIWDPTFEMIDQRYGPFATPWTKRCYMLNTDTIKLRPVTGFWMLDRKPPRVYDRYVHYWARTCSYRLTCNQRNANAVLSIA
jgi:hypothetical protein